MTYKELLQHLQQLDEEQLNCDVCVCNSDEDKDEFHLFGVEFVLATKDCRELEVDYPVIRF